MRSTWLLTRKELLVSARQRGLFVVGFVAPLGLALILNLVFGGLDDPEGAITFDVAVVDLDGGDVAEGFVGLIDDIASEGLFDVHDVADEDDARAAVDSGDVGAAWIVPPGFSVDVAAGRPTAITVVADVDAPTTASVARSVADGYATRIGTATLAAQVAVTTGAAEPAQAQTIAEEVASSPPLLTVDQTTASANELSASTTIVAGMALFFVFFIAGTPLLGIIEERNISTLSRLLIAPIPEASIVASKTLAAIALGCCSLTALMVASTFLMGADWGPPVGAALLVISAIIAVTGIMWVAGSGSSNAEAANTTQGIVAVVLAMLGGAFVPITTTNGILTFLQKLTPHGWFYEGLEQMHGGDVAAGLPAIAALLAMGGITLAIGLTRARRSLRR